MKRVILAHGWDGTPTTGWFPWLQKELESRGFEVTAPQLPETGSPHIDVWVAALASAVGTVDEETYLVGHSMGCQAIVRFLETLPEGAKAGGVVFVAGFFRPLTGLESEAEMEVDREWSDTPVAFEKVRSHMEKSFAIFSDNDPWVPLENADDFKNKLESEVVVQHEQGHFNESGGFRELPIVLQKLLEMSHT